MAAIINSNNTQLPKALNKAQYAQIAAKLTAKLFEMELAQYAMLTDKPPEGHRCRVHGYYVDSSFVEHVLPAENDAIAIASAIAEFCSQLPSNCSKPKLICTSDQELNFDTQDIFLLRWESFTKVSEEEARMRAQSYVNHVVEGYIWELKHQPNHANTKRLTASYLLIMPDLFGDN